MYGHTKRFARAFPKHYKVVKELPPSGGSLVEKVSVKPALIFEILEVVFGPYDDLFKDFKWVDDKVTWHRFFETDHGILCVYDFKGGTSIAGTGEITEALKTEAREFKDALEKASTKYPKIRERDLREELHQDPLRNFLRTFLATNVLLLKAREDGSLLEGLVLYASTIDAHLRYGIILSKQLRDKSPNYEKSMVFQSGKTYISERAIHQKALDEKFISKKQFAELSTLYEFRNKAVHRYFISDLQYKDLPKYLERFERLRSSTLERIVKLEHRQVKKGVGMIKAKDIATDSLSRKVAYSQEHLKIDSSLDIAVVPKRKHVFPREYGPRKDVKEIEE